MSYQLVVIFAENPNDAQALEHLLRYVVPNVGIVRKPRRPLVLIKGRPRQAAKDQGQELASAVRREQIAAGKTVDLVVAHEDCDAVEPAHVQLSASIVSTLRQAGVPNPVAAVPAWELEAWWYLWPDAVAAVCPGWKRLTRTGAVGMLADAKEQLRRDLRPSQRSRVPDYAESDAPRIAKRVREQGKPPSPKVQSGSFDAFRGEITRSPPRQPGSQAGA